MANDLINQIIEWSQAAQLQELQFIEATIEPLSALGLTAAEIAQFPNLALSLCGRPTCTEAELAQYNAPARQEAANMGFLDTLVGGVQTVLGGVIQGAQTVIQAAPVIIGAAQAIQATQAAINGSTSPAPTQAVMPAAMAAGMMAASGGAATQGSAAQEAFAAACRTDPACTAAIWQALQGGNVTPGMMNGSDLSEAQLAAAGIPASLIMALRGGGQTALNTLRQLIPGLAAGAAVAVGTEALTGLLPSPGGAQRFPRAIFVPDPRGGVREYKYRGRPVLYSGDIAAARRVVKVAKRARSARGGARRRSTASQILMLPAGGSVSCGKCGNGSCSGC